MFTGNFYWERRGLNKGHEENSNITTTYYIWKNYIAPDLSALNISIRILLILQCLQKTLA